MRSDSNDTIAVLKVDPTVDDNKVNEELRSIWMLLRTDERLREQARQAGINDVDLKNLGECPYVSKRPEGQIGIAETIIVAVVAQLAKDAAKSLWDKVIWPRLERRFGAGVEQQNG